MPSLLFLAGALGVGLVALAVAFADDSEKKTKSAGPKVRVTPAGGGFRALRDPSRAVFAVKPLAPGASTTGTVRVRNEGQGAGLFTLSRTGLSDRPGPNGGRLSERLSLEMLDVTGPGNPAVVYRGGVGPLDTRPLGVLAPGESRLYELKATALKSQTATVPLGGGNPYESSSTRVSLAWRAIEGLPPSRLASLLRPIDRTGPRLRLVVAPSQAVIESGRLRASLRCSEPCEATAAATVPLGQRPRLRIRVTPGRTREHRMLLAFPRSVQGSLRRTLEEGGTVALALRLEAKDRAGNRSRLNDTLRLRPRR